MKKTVAILLAGIFIFNWFGYRLVSYYLEQQANVKLQARLDSNNYNEADLISLKVPANLPYYTNSKHYQRVDGQIEINGVHYNYVKRRLYNDSLEYLCIPNKARMNINNARDEFFKLVNDLQRSTQNKKPGSETGVFKNLLTEFYEDADLWCAAPPFSSKTKTSPFYLLPISSQFLLPQEQPPDA